MSVPRSCRQRPDPYCVPSHRNLRLKCDAVEMATPPVNVSHLRPWVSVLFLEVPAGLETVAMGVVRHRVEFEVSRRSDMELVANGLGGQDAEADGLDTDGLLFRQDFVPSWGAETAPWTNREHHLVLWVRRGSLVAVYSSSKSIIGRLQSWLDDVPAPPLRRVAPEYLYAAFAAGEAKILWLGGIHPSASVKPDGKTIRGVRLQDALDRLEDQTFFDSAIRASLRAGQSAVLDKAVTSDAHESRAAYGPTTNWADFVLVVDALLAVLEDARAGPGLEAPYPYLARVVPDLTGVKEAFEAIPTSVDALNLRQDVTDDELGAARVLETLDFDIVGTTGASLTADVVEDGATVGTLFIRPVMRRKRVIVEARIPIDSQPAKPEVITRARDAIALLPPAIHYLSGHTVSERRVFAREWRNHPFDAWQVDPFAGVTITKEKPGNGTLADIEASAGESGDDSLFGWVIRTWATGWLVCDDGPNEVADFVHWAEDNTVSLIHVKASSTASTARRVSSRAFEQLAAQASKNIRSFETRNLLADLQTGVRANSSAVWLDGEKGLTRADFAALLDGQPPPSRVSVVLVQPHLRKTVLDAARADQEAGTMTADVARVRRVDDLLHGTHRVATAVAGTLAVYIST